MTLCVVLLLSLKLQPISSEEVFKRLPQLDKYIGETIEFDGYVFKGGVRFFVGKVQLSVTETKGSDPAVILKGIAQGGKFGYTAKLVVEAILDHKTCQPRIAKISQTGSENRFKRFIFQKGEILYTKRKHCKDPKCTNPNHMVRKTTWSGIIPTGSTLVHCAGCKNQQHYVWKVRYCHKVNSGFLDMLGGLFLSRTCDFTIGSSFVVPLVQDRDRWHLTVKSEKEERVKVKAGTFDCVRISLVPKNVGDRKSKQRFEGLFGLNGTIRIWVDKETRVPVRILGSIPFGIMDINCEACLRAITHPKKTLVTK